MLSNDVQVEQILKQSQHRPWPMPSGPWIMTQSWLQLLFVHWCFDPEQIQALIPPPLELDTFNGKAYVAVVPFQMKNVCPRFVPPVPWLSAFPELNVRTYVTYQGKPGVWFFSLDAGNPIAVQVARKGFFLPYYDARMHLKQKGPLIDYVSHRTHRGAHPADLIARYQPTGPVYLSQKDTLEYWLTERYCLFSRSPSGQIYCGEIQHAPWPLQPAKAEFKLNTMTMPVGLKLPEQAPILHYVDRIDVLVWALKKLT